MSTTWNWEENLTTTIHNKSASSPRPPTTLRGHLFQGLSSDPRIYLYGGADFADNDTAHAYASPNAGALWSWNASDPSSGWQRLDVGDASPWQPACGAHAEAPGLGLAFYLNGEAGRVASIEVWGNLSTQVAHLEGMVVLDTANATGRTAWNVSTAGMTGGQPRAGAGMVYVPELGEKGALVLVGGIARAPLVTDDPASGELINLNAVQIWDLASWLNDTSGAGTWYAQTATGDVPALRTDFCVVAGAASDESSYNIYLYGGRNPKSGIIYDDVYALSLPSFTWIKLFTGQSPRWGHTCHLVPNSTQLLTLGGALDLNRSTCDWEYAGVAVLDSWTMTWNSVYDDYARPYKVTQGIAEVIGGGDEGGATSTAPAPGFETQAIESLFARGATTTPAASGGGGGGGTNTGAIVGGVVGGVAGLALVLGLLFLFLRPRRKRKSKGPTVELETQEAQRYEAEGTVLERKPGGPKRVDSELPGDTPAQEMDGEDQFERIVELGAGAGHERFELPGSGVEVKEGEAWEQKREQQDREAGGDGERGDV
ncbi:hypothetical protein SLS57_006636 [Botryosphaeria dothidea]